MNCDLCAKKAVYDVTFWHVANHEESLARRVVCESHLDYLKRNFHIKVVKDGSR
jgi:hypothetical protein